MHAWRAIVDFSEFKYRIALYLVITVVIQLACFLTIIFVSLFLPNNDLAFTVAIYSYLIVMNIGFLLLHPLIISSVGGFTIVWTYAFLAMVLGTLFWFLGVLAVGEATHRLRKWFKE